MIKVERLDNGIKISGLPTMDTEIYDSEAHQLMLGIAQAYNFAPKILGLLWLARKSHGKFCLVAERDELWFNHDGSDAERPTDEEIAMMDQYGWRWENERGMVFDSRGIGGI